MLYSENNINSIVHLLVKWYTELVSLQKIL